MLRRILNRLQFLIERWMQRGALHQMAAMAAVIVTVALVAGLLVFVSGTMTSLPDAVWWAFLRLSDPGYLGDDEGVVLRSVSTAVTVLGYVLFMGSLIAIMTQWLRQRMQMLERGLTPIALEGHLLILGWTSRTAAIVRELLLSEDRIRRFLELRRKRRLRIVILVEELNGDFTTELRDQLAPHWDDRKVILRLGSPLRAEHLRRVNALQAAAILMPGAEFAGQNGDAPDARTVKALMSISDGMGREQPMPPVVAEVLHENNAHIAEKAYRGQIDVLASDAFISRLIAQNVRHPGLSFVYSELLSYVEGNEVYVRRCADLAGRAFGGLRGLFPRAIVLGVVRTNGEESDAHLNPDPAFRVAADDRLILVAQTYDDAAPVVEAAANAEAAPEAYSAAVPPVVRPARRILCLGWSRKVPSLLREFDSYAGEDFVIDIASVVPPARRERTVARYVAGFDRTEVRHIEADYAVSDELSRLNPTTYDNVVFLASDWLSSGEESDARTVLGYLLYRSAARDAPRRPDVVIELTDPDNARLFHEREGEVIISPLVLSHMLAHVALRRELHIVFGELFGPGGAEIYFRRADAYGLCGEKVGFPIVQERTASRGEISLGLRVAAERDRPNGGVVINPSRDRIWTLGPEDEVVVLQRSTAAASP